MDFRQFTSKEITNFIKDSLIKIPVYHGTNKKFDKFEIKPSKRFVLWSEFDVVSNGFFFSENKESAQKYGRYVLTCFINVKKLLLDPRSNPHLGVDRLPNEQEAILAFILRNAIENKRIEVGVESFYVPKIKQNIVLRGRTGKTYHNDYSWIYNCIDSGGLKWDFLDMPKVVKSMKSLGFDGTFVHEDTDPNTDRSIFVLSPEQIKITNID